MITRTRPQDSGVLRPQNGVDLLAMAEQRCVGGIGVSQTTAGTRIERRLGLLAGYDGPFRVTVTGGGTKVKVGQGFVFAGSAFFPACGISGITSNGAEYDWPGTSPADTDTVDISGKADGVYLVYMATPVSPTNGFFTATYRPSIDVCARSAWVGRAVDTILASITVRSGKVVGRPIQRHRGDIKVMVTAKMYHQASTGDFFFTDYQVSLFAAAYARELTWTPDHGYHSSTVSDENGVIASNVMFDSLPFDHTLPVDQTDVPGTVPAAETELHGG